MSHVTDDDVLALAKRMAAAFGIPDDMIIPHSQVTSALTVDSDVAARADEWAREYATDPTLWTDMSTDPFEAGRRAAQLDMTIAECPFGPTEPDERGHAWRQGWIEGEAAKREQAGTFDHTHDEYVAAQRMVGIDPECECSFCEERRAERVVPFHEHPFMVIGMQVSPAALAHFVVHANGMITQLVPVVQQAVDDAQDFMQSMVRTVNMTLANVDVDALQRLLLGIADEQPKHVVTARERERTLLDRRRRSHRRTNRWGPPPGRR